MAPVAAKLAALAEESKSNDAPNAAPAARDANQSRIAQQILKWNSMNLARSVIVLASGAIAWNGTQ
ncbi:hypothetical protein Slin15195_G118250 [Septoria linicola]|uniref:Uncharacterized protein n=1 Tax=Septoria linicola TaxID=215465 RepID=A0A9Q9B7H2_9PEZI|nr:hypothetical protein Slin14017_G095250 [Septoria linicola]USW58506.1 hypothetical protein Slin15195_G118250 [Septoria linicola]